MRFVIAGASGLLGTALRDRLARDGHDVVRLVRGDPETASESHWDPYAGRLDQAVIDSADVVVCLSGAPLTHWPWTEAYKKTFTHSRVRTTRTLAEAVAASPRRPVFLAQNGIAGYGDRGDTVLTEESDTDAPTFMGGVTRQWEEATRPAAEAGARVVVLRSGVVLDKRGGAMKPLRLVFLAGAGGPLGSGDQYFSTISIQDWVRAVIFLASQDDCAGPVNVSGPHPTTNAEFGRELARILHRPAVLRVPDWPIRTALPDISSELLSSARVEPGRLLAAGFEFDHPTVHDRLAAALG
ncbi:MAG TPA: TIGR01777 family oxidoreductase [Nocardioidaceae bacterium]|nr:TIGR01777 family oxidoreductase [Nocardioidaceae bacterium]